MSGHERVSRGNAGALDDRADAIEQRRRRGAAEVQLDGFFAQRARALPFAGVDPDPANADAIRGSERRPSFGLGPRKQ